MEVLMNENIEMVQREWGFRPRTITQAKLDKDGILFLKHVYLPNQTEAEWQSKQCPHNDKMCGDWCRLFGDKESETTSMSTGSGRPLQLCTRTIEITEWLNEKKPPFNGGEG